MKKILLLTLIILNVLVGRAQYYEHLYSDGHEYYYCDEDNLSGFVVYVDPSYHWRVIEQIYYCDSNDVTDELINEYDNVDSIIIQTNHKKEFIVVDSDEISTGIHLGISPCNPFIEPITWKRKGELLTLNSNHVNAQWSTGETTQSIVVSEPGTYSVTLTNDYCGSATYSVEVRDNVELYRATCDLLTNRNKVTWHTTPEQAEYVSAVKVYRNNVLVATVPYTDGSFTDNIGSDATQWQYHLVAVSVEGDDCPIPSYWKRTIHLDHVQGTQGNHILQWTPYEEEESSEEVVAAYAIYDIVNGEAHHVIDVGNFTNVYSYNPEDFSGSAVVAAVFSDRSLEDYAFSNMISITAVDETPTSKMVVYPNPSHGTFTVEGVSNLTVYNMLGHMVATCRDGACTVSTSSGTIAYQFTLPSGIYFVKSDEGAVRKVVVE